MQDRPAPQQQRSAVDLGQLLQSRQHSRQLQALFGRILRTSRRIGGSLVQFGVARLPAHSFQIAAGRDGQQVGPHRRLANRFCRVPCAHEGLRCDVFRILAAAAQVQREAVDLAGMLLVEGVEVRHSVLKEDIREGRKSFRGGRRNLRQLPGVRDDSDPGFFGSPYRCIAIQQ